MKKNRCFKLTALLLAITMMISIIPSFALGDVVNSKGSNVDGIPEIKLNSTFVTSEKILDAGKKEVKDLSAADPNGSFTLNLKVEEPVGAVSDEEKLPPDTSKVIMYYHMENMTAESGENDDISWTFDAEAKDLVFKWKKEWEEDERKSFETSIKIYPNYPAVNDISGSYVLGTATKVMMSVGNFEDGNRVRVRSSAFTEENGMIRPVTGVNPVWTLTHVTGDYYTIRSRNTGEYLYISSGSAYHKPAACYIITEGTTLANPHWLYSRNKIACEEFLMKKYREEGFPVTIVRPSHTYDERSIPLGVHGKNGSWQVIKRMLEGKPVIIQGDGSSLWHLTFNADFAVGYIALMGNRYAIGEAFQITGDEVLTWNQIYQTIADALGVELKAYHVASDFLAAVGEKYGYDLEGGLIGDKSVCVVFDNSKLKRLCNTMCTTIPFHQGVRIALDYILAHPEECQRDDPEFDEWCDHVIAAQEQAKALI